MKIRNITKHKVATGYTYGGKHKRISVTLPEECFFLLQEQSRLTGLPIARIIRQFLPGGME
jgi:hypothetical protein